MPITKNAWIRYKTLDYCFSNRSRNFYFEDLMEECDKALSEINPKHNGISIRQIRKDISFMKSPEGWNIELNEIKVGKKYIYKYSDPKFTITNQPINRLEAEQIRHALTVLQRFNGFPQLEWVQEFIPRLEESFGLPKNISQIIGFDDNPDLKNRHLIGELFQNIIDEKVLTINYKPFSKDENVICIIHPYYLKQFNNRWFLFGWNEEYLQISNLPLDRIQRIEVNNTKYKKSSIDFNEYFDDIFGVTKDSNSAITEIKLEFNAGFADYIITKPISPFQKNRKKEDGKLEVLLQLIPNKELTSLLLGFGSNVKVLYPESLSNSIKEEYKKSLKLYD